MSLQVRLAGYNLDSALIQDVLNLMETVETESRRGSAEESLASLRSLAEQIQTNLARDSFTPETISAAYARISRDPKHVTDLRQAARLGVARARRSNESIIFDLGHASVAEHAVFNFDISGLSRLAAEELQSHRLLSFTEKSQRYISIDADYVVPAELAGTSWEERLRETVTPLFAAYEDMSAKLMAAHLPKSAESLPKPELRDIENRAREDARYLLPLACCTQMGVTMNARNLEHVVLELSDHALAEVRQLSVALANAVGNLAPSLVKYTSRGPSPRANRRELHQRFAEDSWLAGPLTLAETPTVRFVEATPDGEQKVLGALTFANGNRPYAHGTRSISRADLDHIWQTVFKGLGAHDPVLREFEVATMTFEAEISASCFAQLKRHRMMTLLSQDYGSVSDVTIPPSIATAERANEFQGHIERAQGAARALHQDYPQAAPYLLLNAHRKRVLIHTNARELYHFARLRCDEHAQWEIRSLAQQVMGIARREWPNVYLLACGKDRFEGEYWRVFPDDPRS